MGITKPASIATDSQLTGFDCGIEELDQWLVKKALKSHARGNSRVYVVNDSDTGRTVGYYAIAMGSVQRDAALKSLSRNSPQAIPMVILARLAVDSQYKEQGIGSGLLKDCILRSVQAMSAVGAAGILVHAINDDARKFYEKHGFKESPINEFTLMLKASDIAKTITA